MIVLDTNVLSSLMRPEPDGRVEEMLNAGGRSEFGVTSLTEAEIRYGIARLPDGARRQRLSNAADRLFGELFHDRVLSFRSASAAHYAAIVATREGLGRPISAFDAAIAAICREHDADLATYNTRDFEHTGVRVIEP